MLQKLKERYHISRMIRNAINTYPDGICFAATDGRPILANKKINDVCYGLTGHTITNATAMWQTLMLKALPQSHEDTKEAESILCRIEDGTVWQFQRRLLQVNKSQILQSYTNTETDSRKTIVV